MVPVSPLSLVSHQDLFREKQTVFPQFMCNSNSGVMCVFLCFFFCSCAPYRRNSVGTICRCSIGHLVRFIVMCEHSWNVKYAPWFEMDIDFLIKLKIDTGICVVGTRIHWKVDTSFLAANVNLPYLCLCYNKPVDFFKGLGILGFSTRRKQTPCNWL